MVLTARMYFILIVVIFLSLLSACSSRQKIPNSVRTPIEQLLHSEAIAKSLAKHNDVQLHIPVGARVSLITAGLSPDYLFVGQKISGWLSKKGYIVDNSENAQYKIKVIVSALGTESGEAFFGIPPVSGMLIPISLPELAIYKSQDQTGYTKFHLNIYELPSGSFIHATTPYTAETFYNSYTFLFLFSFNRTDLTNPPQLRSLSRIIQRERQ